MSVQDYSLVPGSNTTINGINVGEGCAPANINDAIRQLMADIADGVLQYYEQAKTPEQREIARNNLGLKALATKDKAGIDTDTTGTLPLNRGGTGGTTAAAAREGIGISAAATIIARLNAAVVHSNAAWAAGTATTGGLPSPKQIADAIAALALGVGQEWRRLSAVCGTNYQNVKERPIQLMLRHGLPDRNFSMSQDGIEWDVELPTSGGAPVFPVVPSGWFWRVGGTGNIAFAWEMS